MKIIIQDYTTNKCSESRMLFTEFQKYPNIQPVFWENQNNMSVYDLMDSVNPDFVLIDASRIHNDLIHYFTENNLGKIIILKIPSFITEEQTKQISENDFVKNNVCLSISHYNLNKIRTVNLKPFVDTNISNMNLKHKIPLCIVSKDESVSPELLTNDSFHVMFHGKSTKVDIAGSNMYLCGLYHNYNKLVFDKIDKFEQPFFDAVYRTETYYNSENEKLSEKSVEIFGQDLNIKNNNVDFKKVRQVLSEKYMPKNRAKQLLSQMPIDQSVFTEVVK